MLMLMEGRASSETELLFRYWPGGGSVLEVAWF